MKKGCAIFRKPDLYFLLEIQHAQAMRLAIHHARHCLLWRSPTPHLRRKILRLRVRRMLLLSLMGPQASLKRNSGWQVQICTCHPLFLFREACGPIRLNKSIRRTRSRRIFLRKWGVGDLHNKQCLAWWIARRIACACCISNRKYKSGFLKMAQPFFKCKNAY